MKALFFRKLVNLTELEKLSKQYEEHEGQRFIITKQVKLSDSDFKELTCDFFDSQDWLTREDGGMDEKVNIRAIEVINEKTGEIILVNNEGYTYPRYTALKR